MNEKIMSEEAFNELIANIEVVSKLTLYGRKNIKYYFKKLKQENQNLKDKLEQSIAVADTNSELAESYYNEIKKLKEQYCERTDCSGRIGNSKKVEEVQQENKQLRGSLQTHEILLQANVEENQKLKKQISNLECLVESIKLGVTLNQYQEDLLDKILFRSDK